MTQLWLNGALLPSEAARIDPADRGFTLGDGVFETIAAAGRRPLRLDRHLARLRAGAGLLRISVPYDNGSLAAALAAVLEANEIETGSLRLTLTRGPGARGLALPATPAPTLLITAAPAAPAPPPARIIIARVTRRNEASPLAQIKSLNYLDNILARNEAADLGADDAILLNTQGRVAESTIANLFIVKAGRLLTPPVSEGALPGIRRAEILAAHGGRESPTSRADLMAAEEAFLTSSLSLRAVIAVDGTTIGSGSPGPAFAAIAAAEHA
jgi:branched-chain amino acid aminotransferase